MFQDILSANGIIKQFVWFALICVKKKKITYVCVCTFVSKYLREDNHETDPIGSLWGGSLWEGGQAWKGDCIIFELLKILNTCK